MSNAPSVQTAALVLSDPVFKDKLSAVLPQLRAFARGLCGNADLADDLVQETMVKAWAARSRFAPDTNFRAWTFTILRNYYFTLQRRKRFTGDWDELVADRLLAAPASQDKIVELRDLIRALQQLPLAQREALILVGAGGLSYEETAEIAGVAVGTIKSRVARGREALETLFDSGQLKQSRSEFIEAVDPVVSLLTHVARLRDRHTTRSMAPMPRLIAA